MFSRNEDTEKRQGQRRPSVSILVFVDRGEDAESVDHRQERFDAFGSEPGDFLLGTLDG